jgi:hypothetical protein
MSRLSRNILYNLLGQGALGISGPGLSWVFYHLLAYAYTVPRTCSERLGMPVWKWYLHVLKVFALAALTHGGAWAIITSLASSSLLLCRVMPRVWVVVCIIEGT